MAAIGILVAVLLSVYFLRRIYATPFLTNLDVQLSVSASTATEGDVLTLTEILTNKNWLPLPWVTAKFHVAKELEFACKSTGSYGSYYRNDLFHILMHQKVTQRLTFTCTKRGFYSIDGLELITWDILMENKYIRKYPCNIRLMVYPKLISMPEIDAVFTYVYGQLHTRRRINPDPFEFSGIREYSLGDSMKAINYKASAKGAGLMVNVWDFVNDRQVVILFDTVRPTLRYDINMEKRAIQIAASVADKLERTNTPVQLQINEKSLPAGRGRQHLCSVWESLACIDYYNQDVSPLSREIDEIIISGCHSPEYWIITPYYSKDTEEAYWRMKDTGCHAVWLMPGIKPADMEICEEIIFV